MTKSAQHDTILKTMSAKAGMVHSVSGWTRGVHVNLWDSWESVPYLSALEVCSRQGAVQIHIPRLPLPYQIKYRYGNKIVLDSSLITVILLKSGIVSLYADNV